MKKVELRPVRDRPEYYDRIREEIIKLLRKEVYIPLIDDLGWSKTILKNSSDDLVQAIMSGRISFYRGQFHGRFSSSVSRELRRLGAAWNRKQGSFDIQRSKLPIWVKQSIDHAESTFLRKAKKLDKKLASIDPVEIAEKLKVQHIFDRTLFAVDKDLTASLRGLSVPAQLTPERRAKIADEYTHNLKLDVEGWLRDEIVSLRKKIQEHAFSGQRYEGMIKSIKKSYTVSESKAKFLARQETNLLLSKFKEARYADAGVNQYKWRCVVGSPNHPVRPRHQWLNDQSNKGELFRFDDPPRVTEIGEPVRHANPGEDYNCRCVAIPVVNARETFK